jgi:tetratricopeptide (TPR) repeat protein
MTAHKKGDLDQAITGYNRCLLFNPLHSRAVNNLAIALRKKGRYDLAEACYQRALQLEPDNASALINHGNVLRDLGRYDAAEQLYKKAIALDGSNRGAWYGLGLIYRDMKRLDESIEALEKTLSFTPDDADVKWDLSHSLLSRGDFRRGMALYESRWSLKGVEKPRYPWPEWQPGDAISGKTVLLYGEQGFGDILQFARFIPFVVAQGAKVVLHLRPELVPLFSGQFSGVVQIYGREDALPKNTCDLVAPLMSVPTLLGLEADDIPRRPYLRSPQATITLPEGSRDARLKAGICWQGSPTHKNDRNRSMPFEAFAPLLSLPELALFSLQKGPAATLPQDLGLSGLVHVLDPHLKSFAESAAILTHLDLLITVDTSVLHLAAAMGKPVWLLLPVSHDWRVDQADSMASWYPSVRVFKQPTPGDWTAVMAAVRDALGDLLDSLPPLPQTTS